jgi:hypothetical protein
MALLRNVITGLRTLFRREEVDRELDVELGAYLEMAAAEKMKQGMSRKEAVRAVRLERGSLEVTKEVVRSASWESFVETLWQDLRFAVRMLRKSPGLTAVAVLTLTLGIGATASIFSVVDAVLVRRLPYRNPSRLVSLYEDRSSTGFHRRQFTPVYMVPSTLVVHSKSDPSSLAGALRAAVWSVDPDQSLSKVVAMDDVLDREVEQRGVQALLLGGLAALAMTLACVGIYGVMAYLVTQQNHEIGIRVALGSHSRNILGLVLGRGAKLTAAGVVVGIAAAVFVTRLMRSLLFGVSPFAPLTFATVALVLTFVALAACYIPARRAAPRASTR